MTGGRQGMLMTVERTPPANRRMAAAVVALGAGAGPALAAAGTAQAAPAHHWGFAFVSKPGKAALRRWRTRRAAGRPASRCMSILA